MKRSDDQVGITVQLIDANTERHLWAHTYERNLQNVLELHREVAQAIAAEIRPRISSADPGRHRMCEPSIRWRTTTVCGAGSSGCSGLRSH